MRVQRWWKRDVSPGIFFPIQANEEPAKNDTLKKLPLEYTIIILSCVLSDDWFYNTFKERILWWYPRCSDELFRMGSVWRCACADSVSCESKSLASDQTKRSHVSNFTRNFARLSGKPATSGSFLLNQDQLQVRPHSSPLRFLETWQCLLLATTGPHMQFTMCIPCVSQFSL